LHDEIKTALNEGPLVYELYAILSHSGTANSGHYKAYIKSFENGNL
jgi:ubiquitin C-terminal hydrolase